MCFVFFLTSVLLDWRLVNHCEFLAILSLRRRSLPMTSPGIFGGGFFWGGGVIGIIHNRNVGIITAIWMCPKKEHSFSFWEVGTRDADGIPTFYPDWQFFRAGVSLDFWVNLLVLHGGGKRSLWWFALRWSDDPVLLRALMVQSPAKTNRIQKKKQDNLQTLLRQLVPQMGCFYGVYTLMIEIHPLWCGKNHLCISSRYSMFSKCICVHGAY